VIGSGKVEIIKDVEKKNVLCSALCNTILARIIGAFLLLY
jgi:hypothetical protein